MIYLYGFVRWRKCIWWTIENNYLPVYKLFEFAVEWIPLIRNKEVLSSVQKFTFITAIADKKITMVYCVFCVFCISYLNLQFRLNSFFSLALFSPGIHNGREKKFCFATQQHLQLLNTSHICLSYKKVLWGYPVENLRCYSYVDLRKTKTCIKNWR